MSYTEDDYVRDCLEELHNALGDDYDIVIVDKRKQAKKVKL
jgi:hypothetical protein